MEENAIVAFRNTMELNFDGLGSEKKKKNVQRDENVGIYLRVHP